MNLLKILKNFRRKKDGRIEPDSGEDWDLINEMIQDEDDLPIQRYVRELIVENIRLRSKLDSINLIFSAFKWSLPGKIQAFHKAWSLANPLPEPQFSNLVATIVNRSVIGTTFSILMPLITAGILIFQLLVFDRQAIIFESQLHQSQISKLLITISESERQLRGISCVRQNKFPLNSGAVGVFRISSAELLNSAFSNVRQERSMFDRYLTLVDHMDNLKSNKSKAVDEPNTSRPEKIKRYVGGARTLTVDELQGAINSAKDNLERLLLRRGLTLDEGLQRHRLVDSSNEDGQFALYSGVMSATASLISLLYVCTEATTSIVELVERNLIARDKVMQLERRLLSVIDEEQDLVASFEHSLSKMGESILHRGVTTAYTGDMDTRLDEIEQQKIRMRDIPLLK